MVYISMILSGRAEKREAAPVSLACEPGYGLPLGESQARRVRIFWAVARLLMSLGGAELAATGVVLAAFGHSQARLRMIHKEIFR
jgi:hypothetical protein